MAQIHGGAQERYRRAGTENVAGAVGMAVASSCHGRGAPDDVAPPRASAIDCAAVAGPAQRRADRASRRAPARPLSSVPATLDGGALVVALDLEGIATSAGPACTTGSPEPSHVLTALGYPEEEARGSLRLSLGRTTTDDGDRTRRRGDPGDRRPTAVRLERDGRRSLGQEIGV